MPLLVFNDYMNTLNGDPTTERLLPLVAAAADAGAEVFCIDAGWYDDTGRGFDWWRSVGEWVPCRRAVPRRRVGARHRRDQRARDAGRALAGARGRGRGEPGRAPTALPDAAFLQRHGRRVHEHGR